MVSQLVLDFACCFVFVLTRPMVVGNTVSPERIQIDEISESSAQASAMFGDLGEPNAEPLAPLPNPPAAIGVHFHITVPDGLQDTTVSLMQTLQGSRVRLEVVVDGALLVANAGSLRPPVWISIEQRRCQEMPGTMGAPDGLIAAWGGSLDTIPSGWVLCDGNNGTPDLRDKVVVGASDARDANSTGLEAFGFPMPCTSVAVRGQGYQRFMMHGCDADNSPHWDDYFTTNFQAPDRPAPANVEVPSNRALYFIMRGTEESGSDAESIQSSGLQDDIRQLVAQEVDAAIQQSSGPRAPVSAEPVGGIILWSGAAESVPRGWAICDGTRGTPDLRDKFVVGAGDRFPAGNASSVGKVVGGRLGRAITYVRGQGPCNGGTGHEFSWTDPETRPHCDFRNDVVRRYNPSGLDNGCGDGHHFGGGNGCDVFATADLGEPVPAHVALVYIMRVE